MLDKHYNPAEIEQRLYKFWEESGAFASGRPDRLGDSAQPFCIVIPPPNVTGSLHMGHALNNTIQDILVRFERMRGKDVLWQPGTDHAGIATQMVVERQLMENQELDRISLGREQFLERVWAWKEESGGTIVNQLKRLGASCDWSRERFTMDEGLSRAVIKVFVQLYREGLIYKDKRLVNWDPSLLTAISDLEVQQIETQGKLWHLKYPLEENSDFSITVATTRPETMLGDTAVAVHPDDTRYKHLIGKNCVLPLVGRKIPIIADDYADPEQGSGAVKITPAHDFNDFEVGRRHNLELINIFDRHAVINENAPEAYRGLDRYEARDRVVADLKALGFLEKIEDHVLVVPFGDRSNVVIEPWLTDQWYVNAAEMAKPAIAAVEQGATQFVPKNWEKTYFEWMKNIQPWCISRQLWWGHQIPAWYGPDGEIFVALTETEAVSEAREHYGKAVELERDPDVLDTWFSSALWPFSTLGWPDKTAELDRYYKTDVLVTGFDIIFFWVARMMMMGLHFMDEVPFHTVYIHALVRDEDGAKMSKSKGNVIDPLELIDSYGADALRFTLAAMAAQGRDIKLARTRVEGYRNFATKLWNAARFAEMNECVTAPGFDPHNVQQTISRWILGETERTNKAVTAGIEAHKYNEAAGALYRFVWHVFCDWYLELIKTLLSEGNEEEKNEIRQVTAWVFDQILALLHPFMPFITEELWTRLSEHGPKRNHPLILSRWPELDGLQDSKSDQEIEWVIQMITGIRSVRTEMNVPTKTKIPLHLIGADKVIIRRVELYDEILKRLARLDTVLIRKTVSPDAVQIVMGELTAALPLGDVIDTSEERARLEREIGKITEEIKRIDSKLSNENFTSRAPRHVVDEQHQKKTDAEATMDRLLEALQKIETTV